ncbi:DUF2798 domain-containing protein [Shewanella sp. A3A]|nr:DUF2798 domain-containing protein [Shewanella ferrihydritica]
MKHRALFALVMSLVLTFFMSAWVTYINVGLIDNFIDSWMSAWLLAWPAAGVISFLFGPKIQRLTSTVAAKF